MAIRWINAPTEHMEHTATAARSALDVIPLTDIIGIAMTDISSGSKGSLGISGQIRLAMAADTITDGQNLYWKAASSACTIVATSNKFIGVAVGAIAKASTEGNLLLNRGIQA